MGRLSEKVALISGAARGIGAAIAAAFHDEGARVVLSDIRDEIGRAAATKIGARAQYRSLDVRVEAHWRDVVDAVVAAHGRLDVLVNNAGVTGFDGDPAVAHDAEHAELEAWRAVLETNLDGVFLGCKHAIRAMRPAGVGSIVNMGSRSGVIGTPGAAAYAASKAAVRNHTKSVALYCAEQGLAIRCNVIQPGAILTPMWEPLLGSGPERAQRMAALVSDVPACRFGKPEEVAALAVYLASDESAYTTGAEFAVDGGLLAGSVAPAPPAQQTAQEDA